ncbi:MAG: hypothetical protein ACOYJ6_19930, partial [Caulobacterales bacterium]
MIAPALAAAPGAPYLAGMSQIFRLTRRTLFPALAGGALIAVAPGCSENTVTGRKQLMLVSDAQLVFPEADAWRVLLVCLPLVAHSSACTGCTCPGQAAAPVSTY